MPNNAFNIYGISDPHFGHGNILKYGGRPFKSIEENDETIIKNWNTTLRPQDMCIVLGDVAWTAKSSERVKNYLKRLNGRMILVVGNHDRKSYSWYMTNGFQFAADRFVWDFNGKRILFVHDPENVTTEDRQKYQYVIHGHCHQNVPFVRKIDDCTFVNMSVEMIRYRPMNLITLLSRLTQGYYERNKE